MIRLKTPLALSCLMLLTACGDGEYKDQPVDGRDTDGLYEPVVADYSGRVIDGYLQNARVWMDLDGDYEYDADSVEVVVGVNPVRTITLDGGEPMAITEEGGRYKLDLKRFDLPASVANNLDPADYPLVVTVIPGVTEEETGSGNVVLQHAYQMSAPPGSRNVSPLTTLVDSRRVMGLGELDVTSDLGQRLANINLTGDYIQARDDQAHAYARVLARFLADQFPDDREDEVVSSGGAVVSLSADARRILRLTLNDTAVDIITAVDAALGAGGQYSGIDTDAVTIPQIPQDLSNPVLLKRVFVRTPVQGGNDYLGNMNDSDSTSAELAFKYNEAGILQAIEADGCMSPSITEIARLAMVNGRVADLNIQGLEGFYLDFASSRPYWNDDQINEKLVFNWADNTASFYTATDCHGTAPSSELGSTPQQVFSWTLDGDGAVASVTSSGMVLTPVDDGFSQDPVFSYSTTNLGGQAVTLQGAQTECLGAIAEEDLGAPRVVSAQQDYAYSGNDAAMSNPPVPDGGILTGLNLDWDVRGGLQRLLRRVFFEPSISTTSLLQWDYDPERDGDFFGDQHNLIREARLGLYDASRAWTCGQERSELISSNLYAVISYEYIHLADAIAEGL